MGTNSIKLALFSTKKKLKKSKTLIKYDYLEEDVVSDIREVNETHIVTALKTLLAEVPYRRAKINVGLSTDFQNIFFLQLPQIASHELKQALFWELAPLLSGPVDNYEYDFSLLPQSEKKKINVLLAVVKKTRIEWLQKVFKSLTGSLNLLETTTLPTVDLFNHSHPKMEETVGIIHLGGSNSHYTILDHTHYPEFLYLPFGGNVINTIIAKTADIPVKEVEYLRRGLLEKSSNGVQLHTLYMENKKIENKLKDLTMTIKKQNFRHFYNTGQKVEKLYVTGGLLNDTFIHSFFKHSEKIMEIPAELWDPIKIYYPDFDINPSNAYQFSTAIGLALR
ncbi:MAG: pilus assembly protein PilM [Candidatus Marinimicrobia bacterium]|nr:pilus assembly protein PilM [Candidatus Neomarinimicrobiota bacterium]